jgi:hypothetical protein
MSQTLSNIDLLTIAQAVKLSGCNDDVALPPQSSVPIDLTVHFTGTLERGKGSDRAGTNRARSVPTICLLLQELGCTREYAPVHIIELWNRLAGLTKKTMGDHVAALTQKEQDNYSAMLGLFDTEIVDNLPRIPAKGGVKFKGTVEKV